MIVNLPSSFRLILFDDDELGGVPTRTLGGETTGLSRLSMRSALECSRALSLLSSPVDLNVVFESKL